MPAVTSESQRKRHVILKVRLMILNTALSEKRKISFGGKMKGNWKLKLSNKTHNFQMNASFQNMKNVALGIFFIHHIHQVCLIASLADSWVHNVRVNNVIEMSWTVPLPLWYHFVRAQPRVLNGPATVPWASPVLLQMYCKVYLHRLQWRVGQCKVMQWPPCGNDQAQQHPGKTGWT